MASVENRPLRYLLQAVNYSVFMALVWYFSTHPPIKVREPDEAVITVAFAHAAVRREPCRKLSQEELAELALNMRTTEDCPRERSPVKIEALLNGDIIYADSLRPPGLYEDGVVDVYFSRRITAGTHHFEIRMDDSVREPGFNHALSEQVTIDPGRILLVDFENGEGFTLR